MLNLAKSTLRQSKAYLLSFRQCIYLPSCSSFCTLYFVSVPLAFSSTRLPLEFYTFSFFLCISHSSCTLRISKETSGNQVFHGALRFSLILVGDFLGHEMWFSFLFLILTKGSSARIKFHFLHPTSTGSHNSLRVGRTRAFPSMLLLLSAPLLKAACLFGIICEPFTSMWSLMFFLSCSANCFVVYC